MLPPLMFSDEEIEAIVLGSRWVPDGPTRLLAAAARRAGQDCRRAAGGSARGPRCVDPSGRAGAKRRRRRADLRWCARRSANERKLGFLYRDAGGRGSERMVWPFALGFFDKVRVVVAWCEMRKDFRHFRADRISDLQPPISAIRAAAR